MTASIGLGLVPPGPVKIVASGGPGAASLLQLPFVSYPLLVVAGVAVGVPAIGILAVYSPVAGTLVVDTAAGTLCASG